MRAPAFWADARPGWKARLLAPLGAIYGAVTARRMARRGARAAIPVICVGNFTAGGAGKTPTAIALARLLAAMGEAPFFLSRGYGGRVSGPVRVDPTTHRAAEVGDEPLLLAAHAPVIVARDRPAGAALAAGQGATVIIMDDGLQNPSLVKDLRLAVIDGEAGFGNGLCVPAGPLRAPLGNQIPHVDMLLSIGPLSGAVRRMAELFGKPLAVAELRADPAMLDALRDAPVLAFAGIGRPEKFFATLRDHGIALAGTHAFADHHPYTQKELAGLLEEAGRLGARLVTTQKDMARIAGLPEAQRIAVLPVTLVWRDPVDIATRLSQALAARRKTA